MEYEWIDTVLTIGQIRSYYQQMVERHGDSLMSVGTRGSPWGCPLARYLMNVAPEDFDHDEFHLTVSGENVFVLKGGNEDRAGDIVATHPLTRPIQRIVWSIDGGKHAPYSHDTPLKYLDRVYVAEMMTLLETES